LPIEDSIEKKTALEFKNWAAPTNCMKPECNFNWHQVCLALGVHFMMLFKVKSDGCKNLRWKLSLAESCLQILKENTMLKRILLCSLVLVTTIAPPGAIAQAYPNKTVRLVVPFAPGSAIDITARIFAEELRMAMGQSFLVENKPGASAQIGADYVAKAAPDGYTLLVASNTSHSANPFLFKKLTYDPIMDFMPVAGLTHIPQFLFVNTSLGVRTASELVSYVKSQLGKTSFGYGNSIGQIVGATFSKRFEMDSTPIAYRSAPQAIADLLGGQVTFVVAEMATGGPFVRDGRLKALAVTSMRRSPKLPEVPAFSEIAEFKGFEVISWVALFTPAGTPKEIVDRLSGVIKQAQNKAEVKEKIAAFAAEGDPSGSEELGVFVKAQLSTWGRLIKDAGIQPE